MHKEKLRSRKTLLFVLTLIYFVPSFCFAQELSQPTYQVIEQLDVQVPMRDGIRLSTNIYRPDSPGKFPVLLLRTPYGNNEKGNQGEYFYVQHGYVVVVQDVRGRYESEGMFDAFQSEGPDGFDTQEWIGKQPWCNEKIGTFGGSYEGVTQWLPAAFQSRYLKAMFTAKTFSDLHSEVYKGGAFRILRFFPWSFSMSKPEIIDQSYIDNKKDSLFRSIPLVDFDKLLGWKIPFLRDRMAHPQNDQYWSGTQVKDAAKIRTAVYNLGGWFDSFQQGTFQNFIKMTAPSIDPEIRLRQKLIVGPWRHGSEARKTGDLDFGESANLSDSNSRELQLRWFDNQLKGLHNGIMEEPPVKIFVMGKNIWRFENEWPLARTKYTKYYFHSSGKANTASGNGVLEITMQKNNFTDTFRYDPSDPVPTIGNLEPVDQRKAEAREDVLVYSTDVLKKDIEVTGPITVELYASSSAVNTDFTGKLVDVYPDGRAIVLCQGIIRASFRDTNATPSFIQPGKIYKYNINVWATSNVFKSGHRIRVEISSSNFPMYDRNLNSAIIPALGTSYVKAKQTIYHNKEYPSCIILPIID
jgi:putative CocE/NonD family hydrolase